MLRVDLIDGDQFRRLAAKYNLTYIETHEAKNRDLSGCILTHHSDGCILPRGKTIKPRLSAARTEDYNWPAPESVRVWFAQNADVRDERIVPIPIGLECDKWHPHLWKKETILTLPDVEKTSLLYLNFNPETHWVRPALYEMLGWGTVEPRHNGVDFLHYAQQIKRHKFVLCPDGNGMDTHRIWETLYLGSYPVVERHVFTEEFAKILPLLVVDDWSEVTEQYLHSAYEDFVSREWNWEALTIGYWENLIKERTDECLCADPRQRHTPDRGVSIAL